MYLRMGARKKGEGARVGACHPHWKTKKYTYVGGGVCGFVLHMFSSPGGGGGYGLSSFYGGFFLGLPSLTKIYASAHEYASIGDIVCMFSNACRRLICVYMLHILLLVLATHTLQFNIILLIFHRLFLVSCCLDASSSYK